MVGVKSLAGVNRSVRFETAFGETRRNPKSCVGTAVSLKAFVVGDEFATFMVT
jgi:hypothetical protein